MKNLILYLFTFILVSFKSFSADFNKYFPHLIAYEGVDFTVTKYDRGGATKFGITLPTYRKFCEDYQLLTIAPCDKNLDGKINSSDLRKVLMIEVKPIYKLKFWDVIRSDSIENQAIAELWTDLIINSGVGYKSKHLKAMQKIVGVKQDGKIGVKTLEAINKGYAPHIFDKLFQYRLNHYKSIVRNNKSQKIFYNGWTRRINKIYQNSKDEKYI
jgi:lysozyme family protein